MIEFAPPLHDGSTETMDGFQIAEASFDVLVRWAADLAACEIDTYAPPRNGYPSWLAPIHAMATAHGGVLSDTQAALARAAANLCRWGVRIPTPFLAELEAIIDRADRADVERLFPADPWLSNFVLNIFEFVNQADVLVSYPWNISLPIADVCNARCTFCTSWIEGKGLISIDQVEAFAGVIEKAVYVGLVGHGEPLAHPQFGDLGRIIADRLDPRAITYTITNGVYLKRWAPLLHTMRMKSVSISLNAATARTHDVVMGLGEDGFSKVIEGITELQRLGEADEGGAADIAITMVVTQQNLHEAADFIRLGEALGVKSVWLRTLLPQADLVDGLNYHTLAPTLHPDFDALVEATRQAIAEAKVAVHGDPGDWSKPVLPAGVLERVALSPPRLVDRAETLRNRALRNRTQGVYAPESMLRRGRPLKGGEFAEIEWRPGGASIKTSADQWSWVLATPVLAPLGERPTAIEVEVKVVAGKLGVGLWRDAEGWLDRRMVGPGDDPSVALALPPDAVDVQFVIDNCADTAMVSAGEVSWPRAIWPDGHGPGRNTAVVDLTQGVSHNTIDPINDGHNPFNRLAPFSCKAPYYNLYINEMYFRMVPCCYMTKTPGYEEIRFDGSIPFDDAWNAPGMRALRRSLAEGPLFGACQKCPATW